MLDLGLEGAQKLAVLLKEGEGNSKLLRFINYRSYRGNGVSNCKVFLVQCVIILLFAEATKTASGTKESFAEAISDIFRHKRK